jgi:hypothetical protein
VPGASIAVIVHLEATPARTYDEVAAAKRSPARKLVGARPGRNSDSIELHSLPSYPLTDPHQSDILQYGQIGSGNACYRNQLPTRASNELVASPMSSSEGLGWTDGRNLWIYTRWGWCATMTGPTELSSGPG